MGNSRSIISVSFIGKHALYVVLRVEQQLRTMSVCYLENDASLPVVKSLATAEAWSLFVLFKIVLFPLLCELQYRFASVLP